MVTSQTVQTDNIQYLDTDYLDAKQPIINLTQKVGDRPQRRSHELLKSGGNLISTYSYGYNSSWEYVTGEMLIIPREGKTKNLTDLIRVIGSIPKTTITIQISDTFTHFVVTFKLGYNKTT